MWKLADELKKMGHKTGHRMVAELLREMNYSLQANRKTLEGSAHPRSLYYQRLYRLPRPAYRGVLAGFVAVDSRRIEGVHMLFIFSKDMDAHIVQDPSN